MPMRPTLKTLRTVQPDQRGFTLIETLVAIAMMLILTTATVSLFVSTVKDQSRITTSADQVGQARSAIRAIVDDVRQGSTISTATAEELKLLTYIHAATCTGSPTTSATAIQCAVTYKCAQETSKTTFECTRKVETGTAVKVVGGLSSKAVFTYLPGPPAPATSATYINVTLIFPSSTGNNPTTLESGATLRNSATNLSY